VERTGKRIKENIFDMRKRLFQCGTAFFVPFSNRNTMKSGLSTLWFRCVTSLSQERCPKVEERKELGLEEVPIELE